MICDFFYKYRFFFCFKLHKYNLYFIISLFSSSFFKYLTRKKWYLSFWHVQSNSMLLQINKTKNNCLKNECCLIDSSKEKNFVKQLLKAYNYWHFICKLLLLLLLLFCAVNNLTDKNKFLALQRQIKIIKHFLYNTKKSCQNAKATNKSENNEFKPSAKFKLKFDYILWSVGIWNWFCFWLDQFTKMFFVRFCFK